MPINQMILNTTNEFLTRLRQENGDFKGSLSYTVRYFKKHVRGIGEMAQRLRMLAALQKDSG